MQVEAVFALAPVYDDKGRAGLSADLNGGDHNMGVVATPLPVVANANDAAIGDDFGNMVECRDLHAADAVRH